MLRMENIGTICKMDDGREDTEDGKGCMDDGLKIYN